MATLNITLDKGSTFERILALKGPVINDIVDINSTTTISGILRTDVLSVGMSVIGTGIPLGATIATIIDAHSITISAAATATTADLAVVFKSLNYIDFTNYEFRSHIRVTATSTAISGQFSFTKNLYNTVTMKLTATDTSLLIGNSFVYDVEMYTALDSYVTKILSGTITANDEVTR